MRLRTFCCASHVPFFWKIFIRPSRLLCLVLYNDCWWCSPAQQLFYGPWIVGLHLEAAHVHGKLWQPFWCMWCERQSDCCGCSPYVSSCMLCMDWNSHSCIGKSCDGWEMGLCYLSSDCTGLEEMVKVYIWQWLSWFKIRFWYLRQCVSVIFLGCCLCDWNGLGEHWTPRTCMRYPYQVSSYCKCVASPKSCSGVCTLMVENSVLADSVSYLNRTSMFEWCVSDQLRPILPYVVSMSIS